MFERIGSAVTDFLDDGEVEQLEDTNLIDKVKQSNPKDALGISKAPITTVSFPVMAEVGVAMLEGAVKYGKHNYREIGVRASVYVDACINRHLGPWWEGEDVDPDSGLSHVTKAIAGLMVLRDAMIRGKMVDDRPVGTSGYIAYLNEKTKEVLARREAQGLDPEAPFIAIKEVTPGNFERTEPDKYKG